MHRISYFHHVVGKFLFRSLAQVTDTSSPPGWLSVCLYFCFGKEEGKATRLPFHKRVKRCRGYEKDDEIHEQDEGVAVQSQITRSNHISHESHSHTFGSLGMRRDGRKEVDGRQQQQQQKKLMIRRWLLRCIPINSHLTISIHLTLASSPLEDVYLWFTHSHPQPSHKSHADDRRSTAPPTNDQLLLLLDEWLLNQKMESKVSAALLRRKKVLWHGSVVSVGGVHG